MKITAVIITKNEEKNIARCLDSLQRVADEIIVIDAFSQDKTAQICQKYPNLTFIKRPWEGYAAAKNYGNSLAKTAYILSIDADEVLSEALQQEIVEMKPILRGGYLLPRLNHVGNQPVRSCGWYPDAKVRLFPHDEANWVGDYVHEKLSFQGNISVLKHDLWHFTYQSATQFDEKMQNYAILSAKEWVVKGKNMTWLWMLLKVVFKFIHIYIFKGGFLDRQNGWLVSTLMSKSVYWKYLALQKMYFPMRKRPSFSFSMSKIAAVSKAFGIF